MDKLYRLNKVNYILGLLLFLVSYINSYSQITQVNILGGAQVTQGSTITISAGSSIEFRITNVDNSNCKKKLDIKNITISNTTDFSISPNKLKKKVYPACNTRRKKAKYFDFDISADNITSCGTYSTVVTIITKSGNFSFTVEISTSSEIYVLGGSPWSVISNGATATSAADGTYFGVVNEGSSVTRTYIVANIGSCPLDVNSVLSSNPDFTISSPYTIPFIGLAPYYYIVFDVTFTAPIGGTGTQSSIISIANNDTVNNPFTFTVSAEMFNFNIPGPGGVTADFRLWLKSTRGITVSSGNKIASWEDIGTNRKNAIQPVVNNQPTYYDDVANNINFNPVIKFQNDGASVEQFLYNTNNGFYSQDIFMVLVPDETITTASTRKAIFSGYDSGSTGDLTGIGFGNYTSRFTNEVLTYGQDVEAPSGTFYGIADTSGAQNYQSQGIINIRNNAAGNGMQYIYNGNAVGTTEVNDNPPFSNVGYIDSGTLQIMGTPYKIGKNFDIQGSLNGRVAEILTFANRVTDADRPKIESYLAIKYGITLGVNGTSKNYVNSSGTVIWDVSANAGFNYNIAGIARDSISDLNQKQSKSINNNNEVTIGLNGMFDKNSDNTNEFNADKQALMWGSNNAAFSGTSTNTVTIATGLTSTITKIDRKWKIVESGGDSENTYIAIPATAFSNFSKTPNEEYALIVADNAAFTNTDIIDVVPLRIKLNATGNPVLDNNGSQLYYTWYDFETTKYFTFGKVSQVTGNHAVNIASGDYLVGEYDLNLNKDAFTISAWIKNTPTNTLNRTIMAKGAKLQLRLNSANKIEVFVDTPTPTFTSSMAINDSKWHQITFVYDSGTILLYVDGILDSSIQNIVHPSPNYNRFSIGALYRSETDITNPFLGDIDEAYVWDFALSENQIWYLMNQEAEKVTGNFVSGKVIPYATPSNELVSIPWSNLRAYYDFNSFYGGSVEGKTDDRYFLRINYLKKDKTVAVNQTAPLPYISLADGTWDTPATWLNSSVQMLPNSIGLDGVTSIDWNIVETTHNITSGDRDIAVLGYKMDAGKLTVANPNTTLDETNNGHGLFISHYFELDGVLDLVGESQLIQYDGSVLDEDSGGYTLKDEQGTASSYNYNDWSSSVGPINGNTATRGAGVASTNSTATIASVMFDGTDSSNPKPINYASSYSAADGAATSPITLSTYWMYTFNGADNDYNAWNKINQNSALLPGEGFTMKGSSGTSAVTDSQNYVFKGKPYNGDFTLPIAAGDDRLIGNPYPSAMDADEFILDNIKQTINFQDGRNTVNVFNGALYFWHHFAKSSHNLADYQGGYATYTLMGGTQAYSTDTRINATGASGNKIPERYIPVNQGFFVVATLDPSLAGNTTTTVDGGAIVFKNSQRVFVRKGFTGTNDGSLFFKSNAKNQKKKSKEKVDQRSKIRLDFRSAKGYHRQLLVGADSHATKNFDLGYDAIIADLNADDIFWNLNGAKLVIQAVNNFDDSQELPLGIKVKENGLITIKIDSLQNLDVLPEIYIKDSETNQSYPIKNAPFQINLAAGEYLNRFSLTFKTKKVKAIQEISNSQSTTIQVFMNNKTNELKVINYTKSKILSIQLFNYLGQWISTWNKNLNLENLSLPINATSGLYVVRINTSKGTINKKIIIE